MYKTDNKISDIIKKNDWIHFYPGLKFYCVRFSQQNINIIKDLFNGIAKINTYYLNAVPQIKANDIVINKAKPREYLFDRQFEGKYSASSFRNVLDKSIKKARENKI